MELKIQIKQAGKRENKISTAKLILAKEPENIEKLLQCIVSATYRTFQEKQQRTEQFENGSINSRLLLSEEEIEDAAASGKIDFGFLKGNTKLTEKEAIDNVLKAFEDGLVAVFIDKKRYEKLTEKVKFSGNEIVTFVKLTMLSGRLW